MRGKAGLRNSPAVDSRNDDYPLTMSSLQPLLPDTELTIYCLKGDLSGVNIAAEGFLGTWQDGGYAFLFFRGSSNFSIRRFLECHAQYQLEERFAMTYGEWQGGFADPVRIGRFLLNPPWLKRVPADGEIALSFDPGLVFGNGTHPTTLACLTAVEIACAGGKIERMIDLGTGTGLLALAAAKLDCSQVVAIDNNLLAARTAENNRKLNQLESVLVVCGFAEAFASLPSDLLVANIGHRVLADILTPGNLRHQRWLVLSGLQNREAESILGMLARLDVLVLKRWLSDNIWNTILAITKDGR
jgi:ribosomal protein L11 methyltransferase